MEHFDLLLGLFVLLAYVLDLVFGDPAKLPHPIVYFGKAIAYLEKKLNKGKGRFFKGMLSSTILIGATFLSFYLLMDFSMSTSKIPYLLLSALFFFYGLANKTLIREGLAVFNVLEQQGLEAGRKQLSRIVGRDTTDLTEQQIKKAALETMAENLSDGVVAPVFWFALLGIPGMMAYKMINTLDSMIAYKNERYNLYGRAAAYIDDFANFIPARLTAFLMALVALSYQAMIFIFKYGRKHSSPNAGYPEAALAGILDVRFGGPSIYSGVIVDKPYIGINERELIGDDVYKTARINHAVCFISVCLAILINYIF